MTKNIDQMLGVKISAPKTYDPKILVREERSKNRVQYNIDDSNLPFYGFDTWNAYEVSFLLNNNMPVSGILKIVYDCKSKYIVESKSLKLYLNSFNMEKIGEEKYSSARLFSKIVSEDLSTLLGCTVFCKLHFENSRVSRDDYYTDLSDLSELISDDIEINVFNEDPKLLEGDFIASNVERTCRFKTDMLRSNCKVTHQPDWGTLYVNMVSNYKMNFDSLAKYIISFRNENHFHEEVVEMIFKRLYDKFNPKKLSVSALYNRRGGIDINPFRTTEKEFIFRIDLSDVNKLHKKDFRQ
jgi:7-cyano-7-deazaguanine reductase